MITADVNTQHTHTGTCTHKHTSNVWIGKSELRKMEKLNVLENDFAQTSIAALGLFLYLLSNLSKVNKNYFI